MKNVGPPNPFANQGKSDDDSTPVDKAKFKEKMRKVEAVEKTDPDQKAKKRKMSHSEEDPLNDAANAQAPSPLGYPDSSPLGGSQDTQAPSSSSSPTGPSSTPPSSFPTDSDTPIDSDYSSSEYDNAQDWSVNTPVESQTSRSPPSQVPGEKKTSKASEEERVNRHKEAHNHTPLTRQSSPLKSKLRPDADLYKKGTAHAAPKKLDKKPLVQEHAAPKRSKEAPKEKPKLATHTQESAQENLIAAQTLPPMSQAPHAPEPPAAASYLSPQVHELFQTMVGLVMVKQLTQEGMQGTQMEVSLNNPEYQNSMFYGLKIIITEYQTAPGSYNIELQGTGAQNARLNTESAKLISAFKDKSYTLPFTLNRLDISVKKEDSDFLFKRKGSAKGDKDTHDRHQR